MLKKLPKLPQLFSKLENFPVLKTIHQATQGPLEALGFKWERRLEGEAGLGLWRLDLHPRSGKKKRPRQVRRFVLIPGFGDTPLAWAPVIAMLVPVLWKEFDEIVVLDYPGWHGFLSKEKCFDSLETLFRATDDALDSLKPTALVGHSLGGWVAAQYAASCGEGKRPLARAADKASAYTGPQQLILCAPAGMYGQAEELALWRKYFETAINEGFHSFRPKLFHHEPIWFRLMLADFKDFMSREDIVQFLKSVRDDQMLMDRGKSIQAKTWLIWGEKDSLTPPIWAQTWLKNMNGRAQAVVLPDVGHSMQNEAPAVMTALLTQLLLGKSPHSLGKRWWQILSASDAT